MILGACAPSFLLMMLLPDEKLPENFCIGCNHIILCPTCFMNFEKGWGGNDRLGISYAELTEMQARAIFQAAVSELGHQVSLIRSVAKKVFSEMGSSLNYKVGTMIEIPRAALVADEKTLQFVGFGSFPICIGERIDEFFQSGGTDGTTI
ncbi:Pyruvate, phosphate dikinase [Trema orientale]|uniref:Pyruvate, phosphate dikinase n=1 Tax=Trema orientale TaxID=63057 RepID=A0A2P5FUL8_TREOI|nr:Pyruvate, phosphate dikinase [Trema orientale]